ncbi:MAG TPA: alpha/beta hydrolase [Mycobacterium sp.]|nr:alpha/beta hydrolase [Mycobacterium sp.]
MNLAFDDRGSGAPVLFIAGRGGAGRTWHLHQVPDFQRAGYRCITFDNRGIGATENASGFTTETMVADTAALIEKLDAAPVRIVGVSMGAFIAQELMVARPELVDRAVLMATRGRQDRTREFFRTAEWELAESGIRLPPNYEAKVRLLESFSPKTLNDDAKVRDWIDMFTMWPTKPTPGLRTQLGIGPVDNRLPAYRSISAPTLVIGFADDVVLPPHLGREVADAISNGRYLEIPDAGHLGFIEQPQAVNAAALNFFADSL